ncbi:GntR family transcriptional regulator [Pelomonas sp. CA6]|uniref:GntR family transcriptional regulator n=1 Tax=Pelomonas sp. CA6 TaxID=2907999 RepID=UPI001F4BFC41|nr:GntR family transcriptional regulator [Pelomonas sp. CA6]MCH7344294.1 GntR family transcriptional regulator [Pelomonas sp. CA6]
MRRTASIPFPPMAPIKLPPIDVSQTPSASDLVFERLRRAIISGELPVGQPLRQEDLAQSFNTSRIPVREALTKLEQHGLVEMRRYHGYTVAGLSQQEIAEICQFRALVEAELIAQAVRRLSEETLALAQRCCQAFAKEKDPMRWGDLNRDFHEALYRDAQMPYHLQAVRSALDKTERYLIDQLRLTDGMAQARAEHKALLDAVIARDARLAARLTREHILGALQSFVDVTEAPPAPQPAAARRPRRA